MKRMSAEGHLIIDFAFFFISSFMGSQDLRKIDSKSHNFLRIKIFIYLKIYNQL